jgi:raffinose/stachyose/melibiose transport system substrate-binding protein
VDNFVFGRNNVSVDTPENLEAATKVQEWAANDYFTPGFAGVGYEDSWQLFANGEAAMMITGSWLSGEVEALPNPDNFGFFLVPPQTEGGWKMAIGGTTLAFAIRNGSANPDLAAEYIDWLASDRAKELQVEVGFLPVSPLDPAQLDKGAFFKDVAAAWATVNRADAVGHYLDWATPTYFDTYSAALQELLASRITPEEFIQKLEADYSAYLAEKGG